MAIVKRSSLSTSGSTWGAWFNSLGCSIFSVSGSTITIDETYTITKADNSVTCSKNGSQVFQMLCNNPCVVTVCCSGTLAYIQCSDPQNRRFLFVYEKLTDKTLFGYYNSGNTTGVSFKSITDISYTDNDGLTFTHGAILNYGTELGNIDYTNDYVFNSGMLSQRDTNFISCTTVTADKEVTFNGTNYYAVGPHTLVPIDSEV